MFRFRNFLHTCLALAVALGCCILVKSVNCIRLADIEGARTYFLDSASSQGLQKNSLSILDIARVKGECVQTEIFTYTQGRYLTKSEIAEEIIQKYQAEILFCEEAGGTLSYYGYVSAWSDGVWLYGRKVNLHVAVGEERLSVGTPIIFGGY